MCSAQPGHRNRNQMASSRFLIQVVVMVPQWFAWARALLLVAAAGLVLVVVFLLLSDITIRTGELLLLLLLLLFLVRIG